MFHNWDSFYLLIGSAAGALLGLMFVVATLTAGIESSEVSRGAQVYITPIVFHFAVVVFVSVVSAVVYIGLAVAVLSAVWRTPERAAYGIGAVMVALLLIGIRNAWDLATFIVQRTRRP